MKQAEAKKAARKLQRRLGFGWKTRVWENLGWNYSCSTAFHCMISLQMRGAGDIRINVDRAFCDPRRAVEAAYTKLKQVVTAEAQIFINISEHLGEEPGIEVEKEL
jgi:hypothetical protein